VGKRELAAFLANTDHESGGFVYVREQNPPNDYCVANAQYPCAPGQAYYGRGPIQLSYNYNYGECGAALGKNLLANPDEVATNGDTAFETALWYWMTRQCHEAMIANSPSFGLTIRRINGDVECDGKRPDLVASRVTKYQAFCAQFGVAPGSDLTC
jgi:chitinase